MVESHWARTAELPRFFGEKNNFSPYNFSSCIDFENRLWKPFRNCWAVFEIRGNQWSEITGGYFRDYKKKEWFVYHVIILRWVTAKHIASKSTKPFSGLSSFRNSIFELTNNRHHFAREIISWITRKNVKYVENRTSKTTIVTSNIYGPKKAFFS